jgi:hypothetical protein
MPKLTVSEFLKTSWLYLLVTLALKKKARVKYWAGPAAQRTPAHCSILLLGYSKVKKPAADNNGRLAFSKSLILTRRPQSGPQPAGHLEYFFFNF